MSENTLSILIVIVGFILIGLILLQAKGTGLGSTFGGDMGFYGTKRGAEKIIFKFTIAVSVIFLVLSLLGVIL